MVLSLCQKHRLSAAVLQDIVRMMTTADYQSEEDGGIEDEDKSPSRDREDDRAERSRSHSRTDDRANSAEKDWIEDMSVDTRPRDAEVVRLMSVSETTGNLFIDADPTQFTDEVLEQLFEEEDRKADKKGKKPHNFMTYYGPEELRKEMKVRANCKY